MNTERIAAAQTSAKIIVAATSNAHKARELQALFAGCPLEWRTLADFPPCGAPEEDGATYEANAVKKALHAALHTGEFALADDSGLEVDALGGRPGLHSARYASTDAGRIAKLLHELRGVPAERRTARFVCALAVADPAGYAIVRRGSCPGSIATAPGGSGGFGYDPLFYLPAAKCTMAELGAAEKNRISHRACAVRELQPVIAQLCAGKNLRELIENFELRVVQ